MTQAMSQKDALEVFETYREIGKKVQEKRVNRGFHPCDPSRKVEQQYQLQGSIRGKLENLKSHTKCHICHRVRHWKPECPQCQGNAGRDDSGWGAGKFARKEGEVHLVEPSFKLCTTSMRFLRLWLRPEALRERKIHETRANREPRSGHKDSIPEAMDIQKDSISWTSRRIASRRRRPSRRIALLRPPSRKAGRVTNGR